SQGLWRRKFGADPNVIGRTVRFDGTTATVVGVMPPDFRMLFPPDAQVPTEILAWIPFQQDIAAQPKNLHYLRYVARLRPGATVAEANDDVAAIGRRLSDEFTEFGGEHIGLRARAMPPDAGAESRPPLPALFRRAPRGP